MMYGAETSKIGEIRRNIVLLLWEGNDCRVNAECSGLRKEIKGEAQIMCERKYKS